MQRTMRQMLRWVSTSVLPLIFVVSSAVSEAHAAGEIKMDPATLPLPSGEILLVVDGAINRGNAANEAHLDIEMIRGLPAHRFSTTTAVTDGVRRFDGFLLRDVLKLVDAQGKVVEAQALNNYSVDIPITDFHDYDVMLATHMDGERLLLSDKGPFWIVYPRDDWRQLQDIRYDYRWVWQLHRLTLK